MVYRTRRQNRYGTLKKAHFLSFESATFSKMSPRVPYMLRLIKERIKDYDKFIAAGGTDKQWEASIRKLYRDKGWRRMGEGWTQKVAWRMLRAAEKEWKYKNPAYDSPWEKRAKNWSNFMAKIDATYEKYPRGKTYGKKREPVKLEYLPTGGARVID